MNPIHYTPADSYDIKVYEQNGRIIILSFNGEDITDQFNIDQQTEMVLITKK